MTNESQWETALRPTGRDQWADALIPTPMTAGMLAEPVPNVIVRTPPVPADSVKFPDRSHRFEQSWDALYAEVNGDADSIKLLLLLALRNGLE